MTFWYLRAYKIIPMNTPENLSTKHRYMLYTTEPSDSSKLIQLLNKHNCSFPVILDQKGEFLAINKIEPTYTMIGYICDKNGKVRGSSVIGTSQSFFDREFEYAKYDINKRFQAM